jgi:enamine deaminase RidA (YjgF/YER057c/UK114 family)
MDIATVDPAGAEPFSNFTEGVLVSSAQKILFLSGQIPMTPDGEIPEDFGSQCRLAWRNVLGVLEAAGLTKRNLVKVTVYLSSRRYRELNSRIRKEVLGDHRVAAVVLVADMWDEPLLLTIDAIAVA